MSLFSLKSGPHSGFLGRWRGGVRWEFRCLVQPSICYGVPGYGRRFSGFLVQPESGDDLFGAEQSGVLPFGLSVLPVLPGGRSRAPRYFEDRLRVTVA